MKFLLSFLLFSVFISSWGQDLSGEWNTAEKSPALNYYGNLNLKNDKKNPNVYEGESFDDQAISRGSYTIKGYYDEESSTFTAENIEKIEGTKNHLPSRYELTYYKFGAFEYLTGKVRFLIPGNDGKVRYSTPKKVRFKRFTEQAEINIAAGSDAAENVFDFGDDTKRKREVLDTKNTIDDDLNTLFEDVANTDEIAAGSDEFFITSEELPVNQLNSIGANIENTELKDALYVFNINKLDSMKEERSENVIARYNITGLSKINLNIRDYGEEDGDIVTVYLNDQILVANLKVDRKGVDFPVKLIQNKPNKIFFIANNLGDIPPNTTRIRLDMGRNRYFKSLSVDDQANAVIELIP